VGNGKNMKILKSKQMLQYPYVEWEFVDALEQRLYSKQCRVVPEKVILVRLYLITGNNKIVTTLSRVHWLLLLLNHGLLERNNIIKNTVTAVS
jgi:hypothetical protein